MSIPTLVRFTQLAPQPWANGLGETTELARFPATGDFAWRLSVATVGSDAPFSVLPGVDRHLVALGAAGLPLDVEGEAVRLDRFDVLAFRGEATVAPRGVTGPGLDLNLMTRRERASGSLEIVVLAGSRMLTPSPGGMLAVVLLEGRARFEDAELSALDAVMTDAPLEVSGRGRIAIASISPR